MLFAAESAIIEPSTERRQTMEFSVIPQPAQMRLHGDRPVFHLTRLCNLHADDESRLAKEELLRFLEKNRIKDCQSNQSLLSIDNLMTKCIFGISNKYQHPQKIVSS